MIDYILFDDKQLLYDEAWLLAATYYNNYSDWRLPTKAEWLDPELVQIRFNHWFEDRKEEPSSYFYPIAVRTL